MINPETYNWDDLPENIEKAKQIRKNISEAGAVISDAILRYKKKKINARSKKEPYLTNQTQPTLPNIPYLTKPTPPRLRRLRRRSRSSGRNTRKRSGKQNAPTSGSV